MYNNIGRKIMVLAQVLGWILLIAGIILALICLTDSSSGNDLVGGIGLAVGIFGFISSWFLYGFGQLVDDVRTIRNTPKEAQKDTISDELPEL